MTQLLFIFFNLIFFMVGRGLVLIANKSVFNNRKFDDKEIFGTHYYVFYPLFTIIFLSNLVFILNFFFPIKNLIVPIFLFIFLIVSINFFNRPILKNFKLKIYTFFVFPLLLSISAHGIWLGWDTGLYHLQSQAWIRESNLVIGLSNLNVWLGWSSIYEYLSSLFWLDENYVLIHFLKLVIYNFLLIYLLHNILFNKNNFLKFSSLAILLYSILDNFGYLGGGNGFPGLLTVGKFDEVLGILLYITSALLLARIFEEKYNLNEFLILIYFSLFCFQLKQNGVTVIFPLLIYIFGYIKKKEITFLNMLNFIKLPIILALLWITKNILVTSCLFYPVSFTCINYFDWYGIDTNYAAEGWLVKAPITFGSDKAISEQFLIWLNESKHKQYFYNFLLSFIAIYITNKIFLYKSNTKKQGPRNKLILFSYFIFLFSFWFNSNGANPRYGFGIWLLAMTLFYVDYENIEIRPFIKKYIGYIAIITAIISITGIPRIYSYQASNDNILYLSEIGNPWEGDNKSFAGLKRPTYIESKYGFGVFTESALCWEVIKCHHIDKKIIFLEEGFFSKFLIP